MVKEYAGEQRFNVKQVARDLGLVGHALYKVCGQAIADGLMEEFEQLVIETAQYTGSTAASWNITNEFNKHHGKTNIRELAPGETPLHAGHHEAVKIAMDANRDNLKGMAAGTSKSMNAGISVWNEVPWAERAEEGERRIPQNKNANEAFARFQARVATKVFEPLAQKYTLDQLIQIAKKK
jgi:hypothetical protein